MYIVLIAVQLTGCKSTQTYRNIHFLRSGNHFSGMGSKNTCNLRNPTKAERKYLAYYNYCENLRKSYTIQNLPEDTTESTNGAAAPYLLCTGRK